MIALHLHWEVEAPAPPDRFTRSLSIGQNSTVGVASIGNATVATTLPQRGVARSWRPSRSPDGSVVLFAGHIDNGAQLRAELQCGERGDAALYGACVARWGDGAEDRIVGQYCSAMIDQSTSTVRLARSPVRAPPLHVWRSRDHLVVASTPGAIFATGLVEMQLDEQKIADTLLLNYSEEERSWFLDITRLPIGSRAKITRNGMAIDRYYDPSRLPHIHFRNDEDYVERAQELFEEATRAALGNFSRPAICISGGLDSQAVAAYALQALPPGARLNGYTGVPEPDWAAVDNRWAFGNERLHVEAFAAMYPGLQPHWIDAAGLGFDHKLNELFLLAGGTPRNVGNLHWLHEVWSQASSAGCDVMLTGDYGNYGFSFGGAGALVGWFRKGRWIRLARELEAIRPRNRSRIRHFVSEVALPQMPTRAWERFQSWRPDGVPDVFESWCPINRDWAQSMRVKERALEQGHDFYHRDTGDGQTWRRQIGGGELGDIEQAFEQLHGMPLRDPTSYRPLLEFCWSIPNEQFLHNGQGRWLARRMLRGLVPEVVRTETRYGRQADDWPLRIERQREELSRELGRLMADSTMSERLNLAGLKSALDNWSGGQASTATESRRLGLALLRGLATARFIRFTEGRNDDCSREELTDA